MSVKTIYKCDRCGEEQTNSTQFWTVGVIAKQFTTHSINGAVYVENKRMDVCRPCLESFGIFVRNKPVKNEKGESVAPPTIEDLIKQIVYESIDE